MSKFVTNASGAIWWPNLDVMQPNQECHWNQSRTILAERFTQDMDSMESIPWVRCASGNVWSIFPIEHPPLHLYLCIFVFNLFLFSILSGGGSTKRAFFLATFPSLFVFCNLYLYLFLYFYLIFNIYLIFYFVCCMFHVEFCSFILYFNLYFVFCLLENDF